MTQSTPQGKPDLSRMTENLAKALESETPESLNKFFAQGESAPAGEGSIIITDPKQHTHESIFAEIFDLCLEKGMKYAATGRESVINFLKSLPAATGEATDKRSNIV